MTLVHSQALSELGEGILSLVGTPIGNLNDISPRVEQTLAAADVVLCEDTRVTGKLMSHLGLHVPLERADENVLASKIASTLERIAAGARVAFVSDAGMPGVSDPGERLVDAALEQGLHVEVIPGPSAVTCALVASGLAMDHFFFEGFLPRKAHAKRERLTELAAVPGALVLYESPRRVADTLTVLAEVFPERQVALVRELTKLHEETLRGYAFELLAELNRRQDRGQELKGECVLVIAAPSEAELQALRMQIQNVSSASFEEVAQAGLVSGEAKTALAKRLAQQFGLRKSEAYARLVALAELGATQASAE